MKGANHTTTLSSPGERRATLFTNLDLEILMLTLQVQREGDGVGEHRCSGQCVSLNVVLWNYNNMTGKLLEW